LVIVTVPLLETLDVTLPVVVPLPEEVPVGEMEGVAVKFATVIDGVVVTVADADCDVVIEVLLESVGEPECDTVTDTVDDREPVSDTVELTVPVWLSDALVVPVWVRDVHADAVGETVTEEDADTV
jgi:hypothetical protein